MYCPFSLLSFPRAGKLPFCNTHMSSQLATYTALACLYAHDYSDHMYTITIQQHVGSLHSTVYAWLHTTLSGAFWLLSRQVRRIGLMVPTKAIPS